MKSAFLNNIALFLQQPFFKFSLAIITLFGLLVTCTQQLNTATSDQTCTCGTLIAVNFGPDVPGDNKLVTGQVQADCFAWAEFVALNWPTSPNSSFGKPGDLSPVQWETYMTREVLLPLDGSAPPAWNGWKSPKAPVHLAQYLKGQPDGTKLLFHRSKFNANQFGILDETGQAFPNNAPNWLGAQNGTNLWYEVLVNEDFYNYVVEKGFYNANNQYEYVVEKGDTISLPPGDDKQVGALELKASWMEVTDPQNARWNRFKLSKAVLVDPKTGNPRNALVALIGLHILHKTASQPTWFWATFEHVDNVPGSGGGKNGGFNLYNPNCTAQKVSVPGGCGANKNQQDSIYTVGCEPNQEAPYYLCAGAGPVAMQVFREIPIDNDAKMVNQQMQAFISQNYPGSVWANYQLVNMIWSTTPQTQQGNRTPLGLKSMQPAIPVANTASETFIQSATCFNCHQGASIAPSTASADNSKFASDFSFVFEFAGYPGKK